MNASIPDVEHLSPQINYITTKEVSGFRKTSDPHNPLPSSRGTLQFIVRVPGISSHHHEGLKQTKVLYEKFDADQSIISSHN
jgi:hypothetical protein